MIFPVKDTQEKGSIAILRGTSPPDGAVIKYAACVKEMREHQGPPGSFDCEEDARLLGKKETAGETLL